MARVVQLHKPHLARDLLIIAVSISSAVYLAQNHVIAGMLSGDGFVTVEAFVAGVFFTSLLTIAPAGVALADMMQFSSPVQVALWGAAGAVVGDLLLFFFVRDVVSRDLIMLLRGPWLHKLRVLFRTPFLAWAVPVAGALVIASPLPDEIGIAMLGLSRTDLRFLIPISYAMNFLGILLLASAVQAL